jgi:hypothetical protein
MAHKDYYPDFIKNHDDFYGLDIITFNIVNLSLTGYINKSPLEDRFNHQFNLNSSKPYRAHWMIIDNKLISLYVNGIFNNKSLNSYDLLPEDPQNDENGIAILYHYKLFSGDLILINQQYVVNPIFEPYKINEKEYLLSFKDGNLITK